MFCFMKGPEKLYQISQTVDKEREVGTPTDIGWWTSLEDKYVRSKPSESDSGGRTFFRFQGANKPSFGEIAAGDFPTGSKRGFMSGQQKLAMPVTIDTGPVDLACECTD